MLKIQCTDLNKPDCQFETGHPRLLTHRIIFTVSNSQPQRCKPIKVGPNNLITDVDGIFVGNAEDQHLKSGATVLYAGKPFTASVDVRGGAPGTRETDLLAPDKLITAIDAIVLSGGSAFGLDAASGVMDELRRQGRGFAVADARVPLVSAAIIFDLLNGGDKQWSTNPYPALGSQAFRNASVNFSLGTCGAGTGATTANLKGGLGSASVCMPDGTLVGALVVVNARGSVTTGESGQFWAAPFEHGTEFGDRGICSQQGQMRFFDEGLSELNGANTTIAIVATDARLSSSQLKRLATVSHDGLARAIVPAHTLYDGDLVYSISTGSGGSEQAFADAATEAALGHAASVCLSRAIARGVFEASPEVSDTLPCWQQKYP